MLDLNRDRPDDPFRPFGATPGHAFEWARLVVQLDAALDDARSWRIEAAEHLFARAIADAIDDDRPVAPVHDRLGRASRSCASDSTG